MSIFMILVDTESVEVQKRINKYYPNNYQYLNNIFFVSANSLAITVAKNAGVKGDSRVGTGVVFKLSDSYSGFTRKELWDWLEENDE